ncbi:gliding motility-associated C-terminal domain-containing protein [bacterium SCSIO 12741]|nr:gliding motility-associated C-terminal domain-containing protein [bacterium SCSIO 12741]
MPTAFQAYTWSWTPSTGLSCADCAEPIAQPLRTTEYTLTIKDSLGCFEAIQVVKVEVEVKYSVDVPEAFTPNGDGVNDVIFPAGWGIKDIISFKVFNRWGEMVFESSPDQLGWDGYYKGELQNMETYIYVIEVRTYDEEVSIEEGYFSLIR